jgi:hypothetical protein
MKIETIPCETCGNIMPKLRLTTYGYTFCVKCSESGVGSKPKKAISVLMGEGDHTWVETVIMSDGDYQSHLSDKDEESKMTKINAKEIHNQDHPPAEKTEAIKKTNAKS